MIETWLKDGANCLDIIKENRGATRRNTQELRLLFEKHQIIRSKTKFVD